MIYFTSDLHLMHKNIIKYCKRIRNANIDYNNIHPGDVEGVAESICDVWNRFITDDDEIYILGDVAPWLSETKLKIVEPLIASLKGHKHLILGNHDVENNPLFMKIVPKYFETMHDYLKLTVQLEDGEFTFVLFHYPIEEWHGKDKGVIHLHGHEHSSLNDEKIRNYYRNNMGLRLDVGIDSGFHHVFFRESSEQEASPYYFNQMHVLNAYYKPISAEQIITFFTQLQLQYKRLKQ